jgi:CheY-like chemotaxis protein
VARSSPRVLLVANAGDDFQRSFASRLEQEGCLVTTVSTGAEALREAGGHFDLIILDLELSNGEGDGLTLLQQLRAQANGNWTPAFLLKGEGEPPHVVQRGFDFGASGYLIKHRLPRTSSTRIIDQLMKAVTPMAGAGPGKARPAGRRDVCPFSSRHAFGQCSVFVPLSINGTEEDVEPMTTCSHLRIGTSDTWRLYPRCAIGDQAARDHYLEGRLPPRPG